MMNCFHPKIVAPPEKFYSFLRFLFYIFQMKALSFIAVILAAFFIFVGVSTRKTSGVLSSAVIIGGALMLSFILIVWAIVFIKERKEKGAKTGNESDFKDSDL